MFTSYLILTDLFKEGFLLLLLLFLGLLVFCFVLFFTQFCVLFPIKNISRFKAKFIYLCSGFPGISLHTSYPSHPSTEFMRPPLCEQDKFLVF